MANIGIDTEEEGRDREMKRLDLTRITWYAGEQVTLTHIDGERIRLLLTSGAIIWTRKDDPKLGQKETK